MRILIWHVQQDWTSAFLNGLHEVVVPVLPDRGPDGRGLPGGYRWPQTVREVSPEELADEEFDAVILQRPVEFALVQQWLGRRPGFELPAVYVEHHTPRAHPTGNQHPLAEQSAIPIVHVTPFNAQMWDNGRAATHVVEPGIPDPGLRYTGTLDRVAYVLDEPVWRGRMAGGDLVGKVAQVAPVDIFGIDDVPSLGPAPSHEVVGRGSPPREAMYTMLADRRVYLHLCRWTRPGLSLLEAMLLGMPIVAFCASDAAGPLVGSAATVTSDTAHMQQAVREVIHDPDRAKAAGLRNRAHAQSRYSLARFHADWDRVLKEATQ